MKSRGYHGLTHTNTADYAYLVSDAFAFILEYDSEDDEEEAEEVGGESACGLPHPELSVEDPEVVRGFNVLSLSHSVVCLVGCSCKNCFKMQ